MKNLVAVCCAVLVVAATVPAGVAATGESPTAAFDYAPATPHPDDTVTFDASASADADGRIVEYDWYVGGGDYPDGGGESFERTFDTGGSHTVVLVVEDDAGNTDRYVRTVTVENPAPEARIEFGPAEPAPDETVRFSASDSSDPDGRIVEYDWYLGTGDYPDGGGENFEVSYDAAGTYRVTLVVEDNGGKTDRVTETVTVENDAPTAAFDSDLERPNPDDTVTFDASASTDADGHIESYDWYVGSGDYPDGDGQTFSHRFDTAGVYPVRLVVTDNGGETVERTVNVNVTNPAPVPAFTTRSSPDGLDVTFDASGSSDADGRVVEYDWYVGDGDYPDGDGQTYTHRFDEKGTSEVRLRVTDNGDVSRSVTKTVGVSQRPTADIDYAGEAIPAGRTVTLTGADSFDPDGDVSGYAWTLPDDRSVRGESVSLSVPEPGSYDVSLTVTDDTGNSHRVEETLVAKRPPSVSLSWNPETPRDDLDTTFTAESSMPIESVAWDVDGDGAFDDGHGRTTVHSFDDTGKRTVGARVVAANGVATTATGVVTVQQSAAFDLSAAETTVTEGDSVVVSFSASNRVRDAPMDVKLALDLPDNGASISAVDGASVVGTDETTFVTVGPGDEARITVRIQFTEPGEYEVGGDAVYYFEGSGDTDRRTATVEPISVNAVQDETVSDAPSDAVAADPSATSVPGFTVGSAVVALLGSVLVVRTARTVGRRP